MTVGFPTQISEPILSYKYLNNGATAAEIKPWRVLHIELISYKILTMWKKPSQTNSKKQSSKSFSNCFQKVLTLCASLRGAIPANIKTNQDKT